MIGKSRGRKFVGADAGEKKSQRAWKIKEKALTSTEIASIADMVLDFGYIRTIRRRNVTFSSDLL